MSLTFVLNTISFGQQSCYIQTGNQLYKLDLGNCSTQNIGTTGANLTDIALTPSGDLFGIDFYNLYKINPINASTTFISTIDVFGGGFNSLVGFNDQYLLGVRNDSGLYKINTGTGNIELIGLLGYYPAGDLTFYKGHYYMAESANKLIRFSLNFDYSEISDVQVVGTMNTIDNAVYGIVTVGDANCQNDNLKMIAFEGNTVYQVNPVDASCNVLCPPSNGINAYGAASAIETEPQVFEANLEIPNIFSPNQDDINDNFEPSKILGVSDLQIEIANRWGNIVYSQNSTDNFRWDGKWNGEICSDGTYFYKIVFNDYCSNRSIVTGFVQLVR